MHSGKGWDARMHTPWNLTDSEFAIILTIFFLVYCDLDDHIATVSDSKLPWVALA
jgi:hypothetical protein